MNIFVLLKQTFDTEERIVLRDGAISEDGVKFVINPYDEFAVEQAIQLRDEFGGKVTVVSVGPDRAGEGLRTALAMGADEAVLIRGERIPAVRREHHGGADHGADRGRRDAVTVRRS